MMFIDFLGGSLKFSLSITAGILNVLQTATWLPILIACSQCWWRTENWIVNVVLFPIYIYSVGAQFEVIYQQAVGINPYLLSLATFFGIFHYGLPGIMYVPCL